MVCGLDHSGSQPFNCAATLYMYMYKYSYSIRRCIQDGICLPACDTFLGCRVSTHRGSKGLCRR